MLLLAGTVVAVACANLDHPSYIHITHALWFWVNDVWIRATSDCSIRVKPTNLMR